MMRNAKRRFVNDFWAIHTAAGDYAEKNAGGVTILKTSGAATQVTLPPNPKKGTHFYVNDGKGDAATNNITVVPGTGATTINGSASFVINTNYAGALFVFNGTEWNLSAYYDASAKGRFTNAGFHLDVVGTIAATGSDQAGAALLVAETNQVTAANDAKGVRLPSGVAGMQIFIANTVSAKNLLVYPFLGGTIDYGSANDAYTLAGRKHAMFKAYSATQWYSLLTA